MKTFGEFEDITKDAALLREPRLEGLRVRLLRTALDFYRELQASLEGDASPGARPQLSDAYARAGQVTWELGRPEEALAAMRHSLALAEQMAASSPDDPGVRASLGRAHARMGFTFRTLGRPAEALQAYEQARAIQEALARDDPAAGPVPRGPRHGPCRTSGSSTWSWDIRPRRSASTAAPSRSTRSSSPMTLAAATSAATWRGAGVTSARRWRPRAISIEALRLAERAVDLFERLVGEGHADAETRWRLARCLDEVGRIRVLIGHPSDAAGPLERAAGIFQAVDRENPVLYGVDVVRNQLYLALQREASGRAGEAEACIRKAESVLSRPSKLSPGIAALRHGLRPRPLERRRPGRGHRADEREPRARRAIAALRRAAVSGSLSASICSAATRSSPRFDRVQTSRNSSSTWRSRPIRSPGNVRLAVRILPSPAGEGGRRPDEGCPYRESRCLEIR